MCAHMLVCAQVRLRARTHVCARERERYRDDERECAHDSCRAREIDRASEPGNAPVCVCVFACTTEWVCVCARERERERAHTMSVIANACEGESASGMERAGAQCTMCLHTQMWLYVRTTVCARAR